MTTDGRTPTLIDTSVLLNFIAVDRVALLAGHPTLRFVVTDHVRGELTDRRPERLSRFERALQERLVEQVSVSDPKELEVFGQLQRISQLGIGESAAAAAAVTQGVPMATDDRRARKILSRLFPALRVVDTAEIIRDLIRAGLLSVADADALKAEWEKEHRFKLPFRSFGP